MLIQTNKYILPRANNKYIVTQIHIATQIRMVTQIHNKITCSTFVLLSIVTTNVNNIKHGNINTINNNYYNNNYNNSISCR